MSWESNFIGGSTQTFKIHYKDSSAVDYRVSSSIADPGVGQRIMKTISGLRQLTSYQIKVSSTNHYKVTSTAESDVITTKTLGMSKSIIILFINKSRTCTQIWTVGLACRHGVTHIHQVLSVRLLSALYMKLFLFVVYMLTVKHCSNGEYTLNVKIVAIAVRYH